MKRRIGKVLLEHDGWSGRDTRSSRRLPCLVDLVPPRCASAFPQSPANCVRFWCRRGDSNSHGLRHCPLKTACLPISPRRLYLSLRHVRAILFPRPTPPVLRCRLRGRGLRRLRDRPRRRRPGAAAGTSAGLGTSGVFGAAGRQPFHRRPAASRRGLPCIEPKYVRPRLVRKNTVARIAVVRDRKLAEPAAPNRLPDEPLPNAAPMSAPLPCCSSTKPQTTTATSRCTTSSNRFHAVHLFTSKRSLVRLSGTRDRQKFVRIQRRAADQPAVDIRHRKQRLRIRGLDTAAVQHARRPPRRTLPSAARNTHALPAPAPATRSFARADRPDRLVREHDARDASVPSAAATASNCRVTTAAVAFASRSASVSPTHTIGVSPPPAPHAPWPRPARRSRRAAGAARNARRAHSGSRTPPACLPRPRRCTHPPHAR